MKLSTVGGLAVSALLIAAPLSIASAADMPLKAPPPAPVAAPSWTGWYIGLNAGWDGSGGNITNTGTDTGVSGLGAALAAGVIPATVHLNNNEFLGGAQIGYNWQAANWVYGLEADFDGAGHRRTAVFPNNTGIFNPTDVFTFSNGLNWLGTFRGRVGVTATPSFLLYATGGLAVGQTRLGSSGFCSTCTPPSFTEPNTINQSTKTSAGYAVGAGAEWMFAPRWSVKAEYLFVDLGNNSSTISFAYPVPATNNSTLTSTVHNYENIVRGGINYHF